MIDSETLTRLKQRLQNAVQVIQQIGAEYESTGTIDASNLDEMRQIRQDLERANVRLAEVIKQAEINQQYRQDSSQALPVVGDRLQDARTLIGGLPLLTATDADSLGELLVWIAQAPDFFQKALTEADPKIFEVVRKALDAANVERKT